MASKTTATPGITVGELTSLYKDETDVFTEFLIAAAEHWRYPLDMDVQGTTEGYLLRQDLYVPVAEHIARHLGRYDENIPDAAMVALERAIDLRQTVNEHFVEMNSQTGPTRRDRTHASFLKVFKQVRGILKRAVRETRSLHVGGIPPGKEADIQRNNMLPQYLRR